MNEMPLSCASVAGLRERKKQRTREAIVRHALRLFAERGYDATTVQDIAAAADIAPRTFFGYFPSKEAVVFHDADDLLAAFGAALDDRPEGEETFAVLRRWALGMGETFASDEDRLRRRLVRETPVLQAHDRVLISRFQAVVAAAVAQDLGLPEDSLRPQVVAAAAMAALEALGDHADTEEATAEGDMTILDEALVFLEAGLDALRDRP